MSDAASLVIAARPTYEPGRAPVAAELGKLPARVVEELARVGVKVVVCGDSITDYATDLKGKAPRGWPPESTWDNVPGAYLPDRQMVVIALKQTGGGGWRIPVCGEGHGSYDLVVHETIHGFDFTVGSKPSAAPDFAAVRQADWDQLDPYERQEGDAGLQETFAESAARAFAHDGAAKPWPHLLRFWKDFSRRPAPLAGEPLTGVGQSTTTAWPAFIGVAYLTQDNVLVLDLRADGPAGETGDARLSYEPDDPIRRMIETHLGAEMTDLAREPFHRALVRPFP